MGEEKLDNAVYTIRGYADLADMAAGGRGRPRPGAGPWARPASCWRSSSRTGGTAATPAPTPTPWATTTRRSSSGTGSALTPTDAVLPRIPGRAGGPAGLPGARQRHPERARADLLHRHARAVPHRHRADLGHGRQPGDQLRHGGLDRAERAQHLHAELGDRRGERGQLRPARARTSSGSTSPATPGPSSTRDLWEMPGAMPEIVPGGDFGANIDRLFTERSMVLQAWGAYGVLWPVVHQWLGVSPDLGRGRLAVVPQLPPDQRAASAKRIRLGDDVSIDVAAKRAGQDLPDRGPAPRRRAADHRCRGAARRRRSGRSAWTAKRVRADLVSTARGLEVRVAGRSWLGRSRSCGSPSGSDRCRLSLSKALRPAQGTSSTVSR